MLHLSLRCLRCFGIHCCRVICVLFDYGTWKTLFRKSIHCYYSVFIVYYWLFNGHCCWWRCLLLFTFIHSVVVIVDTQLIHSLLLSVYHWAFSCSIPSLPFCCYRLFVAFHFIWKKLLLTFVPALRLPGRYTWKGITTFLFYGIRWCTSFVITFCYGGTFLPRYIDIRKFVGILLVMTFGIVCRIDIRWHWCVLLSLFVFCLFCGCSHSALIFDSAFVFVFDVHFIRIPSSILVHYSPFDILIVDIPSDTIIHCCRVFYSFWLFIILIDVLIFVICYSIHSFDLSVWYSIWHFSWPSLFYLLTTFIAILRHYICYFVVHSTWKHWYKCHSNVSHSFIRLFCHIPFSINSFLFWNILHHSVDDKIPTFVIHYSEKLRRKILQCSLNGSTIIHSSFVFTTIGLLFSEHSFIRVIDPMLASPFWSSTFCFHSFCYSDTLELPSFVSVFRYSFIYSVDDIHYTAFLIVIIVLFDDIFWYDIHSLRGNLFHWCSVEVFAIHSPFVVEKFIDIPFLF